MAPKQKHILSTKAALIDDPTISHVVVQFGLRHGATSYYKLGNLFDLADPTMQLIVETGRVSEHEYAKKIANKMGLRNKARKDFFLKAEWLEDKDHAIEALREKKAPLWMAILSMYKEQGKSEEDMYDFLKVAQGTFHGWVNSNTHRSPPREYMLKMAGNKCFKLNPEETEIFLEAAGCFRDKAHVVSALRDNRIPKKSVIKCLMEAEAGSVREYAEKIGQKPNTVFFWSSKKIPRDRFITLIADLPVDDQRYLMQCKGRFLDPTHVAVYLKDSNDPSMFVTAFKDLYDLTSDDFGISKSAVTGHRNGSQNPLLTSLVKQFVTVEKEHLEIKDCWDAYKTTCARHMGHNDNTHASELFMRQMDEEHRRQTRQR